MHLGRLTISLAAAVGALSASHPAWADQTLSFDGTVSEGGLEHEFVDFEVPAGVAEIQVSHDDLSDADILDWGLNAPEGFRGWGGGNSEPAIVGELAASRSYLPGPLTAGTWRVVIGKAKLDAGSADYHVEVTLRDVATLAPQTERSPYLPSPALSSEARFYAGDFHVHSVESGDARPSLDEVATFARSGGLDFVELSDHNTVSQLDFIHAVQQNHPDILLVPGVEYTTYAGHANGIGATVWVDHKLGQPEVDIAGAAQAFRAQGALFSINHPLFELGGQCIGCSWKHDLDAQAIDAVEIATAATSTIFIHDTLAFWDALCDTGRHVAAVGGSDDHTAGQDIGSFGAPVGTPTTYVFANDLSVASLLQGIRDSRTVVKVGGTLDPMVELSSDILPEGDTVHAETSIFRAKITEGAGLSARWVKNGKAIEAAELVQASETLALRVAAPQSGQDRYRVEVLRDGQVVTVTSHLWVETRAGVGVPDEGQGEPDAGCGCSTPGRGRGQGAAVLGLAAAFGAGLGKRRRNRKRFLDKPGEMG